MISPNQPADPYSNYKDAAGMVRSGKVGDTIELKPSASGKTHVTITRADAREKITVEFASQTKSSTRSYKVRSSHRRA